MCNFNKRIIYLFLLFIFVSNFNIPLLGMKAKIRPGTPKPERKFTPEPLEVKSKEKLSIKREEIKKFNSKKTSSMKKDLTRQTNLKLTDLKTKKTKIPSSTKPNTKSNINSLNNKKNNISIIESKSENKSLRLENRRSSLKSSKSENDKSVNGMKIGQNLIASSITNLLRKKFGSKKELLMWDSMPLHMACFNGEIDAVKYFVKNNYDVNQEDLYGNTPLVLAIYKGHTEIANFLIQNGANAGKENGTQSLEQLSGQICEQSFDFSEFSSDDKSGVKNPQEAENKAQKKDVENNGLSKDEQESDDVVVKNSTEEQNVKKPETAEKNSVLTTSEKTNKQNEVSSFEKNLSQADIIGILTKKGATEEQIKRFDSMPLHLACAVGDIETVRYLIKNGADVNQLNIDGMTPVINALFNKHLKTAMLLLENGAEVNKTDKYENTPILHATRKHNLEIIDFLIKAGAAVNKKNQYEDTPLIHAVIENDLDIVRRLILAHADVNKAGGDEITPLLHAIKQNNFDIAKFLIIAGADVNKTEINGGTPIICAVIKENLEIIKLLIQAGADLNKTTKYGSSPINFALYDDNLEVVKLLIKAGADINKTNNKGISPILFALNNNKLDTVKFLLESGAKVSAEDEIKIKDALKKFEEQKQSEAQKGPEVQKKVENQTNSAEKKEEKSTSPKSNSNPAPVKNLDQLAKLLNHARAEKKLVENKNNVNVKLNNGSTIENKIYQLSVARQTGLSCGIRALYNTIIFKTLFSSNIEMKAFSYLNDLLGGPLTFQEFVKEARNAKALNENGVLTGIFDDYIEKKNRLPENVLPNMLESFVLASKNSAFNMENIEIIPGYAESFDPIVGEKRNLVGFLNSKDVGYTHGFVIINGGAERVNISHTSMGHFISCVAVKTGDNEYSWFIMDSGNEATESSISEERIDQVKAYIYKFLGQIYKNYEDHLKNIKIIQEKNHEAKDFAETRRMVNDIINACAGAKDFSITLSKDTFTYINALNTSITRLSLADGMKKLFDERMDMLEKSKTIKKEEKERLIGEIDNARKIVESKNPQSAVYLNPETKKTYGSLGLPVNEGVKNNKTNEDTSKARSNDSGAGAKNESKKNEGEEEDTEEIIDCSDEGIIKTIDEILKILDESESGIEAKFENEKDNFKLKLIFRQTNDKDFNSENIDLEYDKLPEEKFSKDIALKVFGNIKKIISNPQQNKNTKINDLELKLKNYLSNGKDIRNKDLVDFAESLKSSKKVFDKEFINKLIQFIKMKIRYKPKQKVLEDLNFCKTIFESALWTSEHKDKVYDDKYTTKFYHDDNDIDDNLTESICNNAPAQIIDLITDITAKKSSNTKPKDQKEKPIAEFIILHGPNGTGKTVMAKALAKRLNLKFHHFDCPHIKTKYENSGPENFNTEMERRINPNEPCVILFDEADSISDRKDDKDEAPICKEIGLFLDKHRNNLNFIVILTTNHLDKISKTVQDKCLKKIEVPLPDENMRERILKYRLRNTTFDLQCSIRYVQDNLNWNTIVKNTKDFSIRKLEGLAQEVCKKIERAQRDKVRILRDKEKDLDNKKNIVAEQYTISNRDFDEFYEVIRNRNDDKLTWEKTKEYIYTGAQIVSMTKNVIDAIREYGPPVIKGGKWVFKKGKKLYKLVKIFH